MTLAVGLGDIAAMRLCRLFNVGHLGVIVDSNKSSEVVIEIAKEFMATVRRIAPSWNRAFWRFESEESRYGSNASYVKPDGVFLISAMKESAMYDAMNLLGRQLWECQSDQNARFCLCLLTIENNFDYDIKFEMEDMSKWRISKSGGQSGIPEGL